MSFSRYRLLRRVHGFVPHSLLGKLFLYAVGIRLLLLAITSALAATGRSQAAAGFNGLAGVLNFAAIILGLIVITRWVRTRLMWKLRNRLIITFIFIAVIPIVLILSMVAIAGYLFANQYATSQVRYDFEAEARKLQAVSAIFRGGPVAAGERRLKERFPDVDVALYDTHSRRPISPQPPSLTTSDPKDLPAWVKPGFKGALIDHGQLLLRSVELSIDGNRLIVTSQPVTSDMLNTAIADNGELRLYFPGEVEKKQGQLVGKRSNDKSDWQRKVSGGKVPPHAAFRWDPQITLGTLSPVPDWATGESYPMLLQVATRPSRLVTRLFSNLSELALIVMGALVAIAVFFALIEIGALILGISLTRTITGSIANLYLATQHINRGDLRYRINVRNKDQLAALQSAFNSMSENLEKLIEEQKEKERLESELAIAQEVQETLFPRQVLPLRSLDVHGVCRPARSVSGDYYDFIPCGEEQLGIALGDISGKGISAALLMATIHSAVRVYEFGGMPAREQLVRASAAAQRAAHGPSDPPSVIAGGLQSPATVMELLNRHLFHSTQPEKYATLFLGVYDGASRTITYCNAGHLPPLIISADGSLRRLDVGGMVIGLFDHVTFEQRTIQMRPGDIFVAFSDGITEPENEFGEFGEERLIDILRRHRTLPLDRLSDSVLQEVQDWIGAVEQPDDVTLVLARAR